MMADFVLGSGGSSEYCYMSGGVLVGMIKFELGMG